MFDNEADEDGIGVKVEEFQFYEILIHKKLGWWLCLNGHEYVNIELVP
jgi:hypothetical protein